MNGTFLSSFVAIVGFKSVLYKYRVVSDEEEERHSNRERDAWRIPFSLLTDQDLCDPFIFPKSYNSVSFVPSLELRRRSRGQPYSKLDI